MLISLRTRRLTSLKASKLTVPPAQPVGDVDFCRRFLRFMEPPPYHDGLWQFRITPGCNFSERMLVYCGGKGSRRIMNVVVSAWTLERLDRLLDHGELEQNWCVILSFTTRSTRCISTFRIIFYRIAALRCGCHQRNNHLTESALVSLPLALIVEHSRIREPRFILATRLCVFNLVPQRHSLDDFRPLCITKSHNRCGCPAL